MINTRIVRKIDRLGRVALPIEIRKAIEVDEKDTLEIYVENERILLEKYEPQCVFGCVGGEIQDYKRKSICKSCISEMKNQI